MWWFPTTLKTNNKNNKIHQAKFRHSKLSKEKKIGHQNKQIKPTNMIFLLRKSYFGFKMRLPCCQEF